MNFKSLFKKKKFNKETLLIELQKHGSVLTLFNLDCLNNEDKPVFYVDDTLVENEDSKRLLKLKKEIDDILDKANAPRKRNITTFYGITNIMRKRQYYVRIPIGKNGGCFNFADEYMKSLYNISKLIQEDSEWMAMTDASCDVLDDVYDFVLTFVLKEK